MKGSRLDADARWDVVIVYDDDPAGQHAIHTFDGVTRQLGGRIKLHPLLWRFDHLEDPDWRAAAAAAAVQACLVIISTSSKGGLPASVRDAHDAMPQGGQLVIETSAVEFDESVRAQSPLARPGSFVCLSVGDNGCGIPPENLPRIFEPFYTTADAGKGTGLGLATVFGIVQQHQGWINVTSEVGTGTIFRIYLPRLAAKSGQESRQPAFTTARGGKETILLVEDEVALRSSMCKALSQLGYRMLESVSGVEAQKVWEQRRHEIDLLLTDLVMPGGVTGKDLAERLLNENPKLKVIYTSGYSIDVVGRDFPLEEGVNFLAKPFGAHRLAQTVRDCLDKI